MYTPCCKDWWRIFRISRYRLKVTVLILPLIWCMVWITIYLFNYKLTRILGKTEPKYLVNSAQCQIKNLKPFNEMAVQFHHAEDYDPCTKRPLLTYTTNINNVIMLNINETAAPSYSTNNVVCCYSNITRKPSLEKPDDTISSTECRMFKDNTILYHDTVHVKCYSREERDVIYENTHATFLLNEEVREKTNQPHQKKPISVLLIGIDNMSRLNFIRSFPNTYNYVERNGWIPLMGYNKIADKTLPNLIAILTGRSTNTTHDVCNPTEEETFDQCPMIWNDYRKLGYITSYAEDGCLTSTFNYKRKGFTLPPTDFYFRPYMQASEELAIAEKFGFPYCTGPETSGERIMKLAKDFALTFKEYPHFGLFWMNTFSRNQLNTPSGMDDKIKEFLNILNDENVLEHSVVIFFSSNGIRIDNIRMTETGWLEDRLPFIYISMPKWFKKTFKTEYKNLKKNSVKLTSPYDLYLTLQHILTLSGHNYKFRQSPDCPSCMSLFDDIDKERSCEQAGIDRHWCTCLDYTQFYLNENVTKYISTHVLKYIYKFITSFEDGWMCSRYFVNNVISSSLSVSFTNDTYLLLKFATVPKAVFESTIVLTGNVKDLNISISGVSRLDSYFLHSECVRDEELKKFCYCLR